jgi:GNAT superfamily N-acetyltransferase
MIASLLERIEGLKAENATLRAKKKQQTRGIIVIRKLLPSDRAQWEMLYRGYMDFYERVAEQDVYDRSWRRLLDDTVIHGFVAEDGQGTLIGLTHFTVHASTSSQDVCYLQDLFTASSSRGSGAGTKLIQSVVGWSRAKGDIGRVYWSTHENNKRARILYDKVGVHAGFLKYHITL